MVRSRVHRLHLTTCSYGWLFHAMYDNDPMACASRMQLDFFGACFPYAKMYSFVRPFSSSGIADVPFLSVTLVSAKLCSRPCRA